MVDKAKQYEILVKELLDAEIFKDLPKSKYTIFHNKKYLGKSGHKHQIDVSVELSIAGINILILVECKRYNKPVSTKEVLGFASRLDDIDAHKGILVTTTGFQSGVKKIAKSCGIALVTVCDLGWIPFIGDPFVYTLHFQNLKEYIEQTLSRNRKIKFRISEELHKYLYLLNATANHHVKTEFCKLKHTTNSIFDLQNQVKFGSHGFVLSGMKTEVTLSKNELFMYSAIEFLIEKNFDIQKIIPVQESFPLLV